MTLSQLGRYRWDAAPHLTPFNVERFPRRDVVGEIKPHHRDGIAAGVEQLRRRDRRGRTPQLLTYRQVPGRPTSYDVLAADSTELRNLLARRRTSLATWYFVGRIEVPEAVTPIPLWHCASTFGNLVEGRIRQQYARTIGITLPAKSGSRTGADIEHELLEMAEFLRELAAELEAEAGPY